MPGAEIGHRQWRGWFELSAPLAIFLASIALGVLSVEHLGEGYASLVIVVGISAIGAVSGLSVALISALAATLVFNFIIAAPAFAFRFSTPSDFAPPLIFALTALISGWLSGRLKDEAVLAREGALRLANLLDISRALQGAASGIEIIEALRSGPVGHMAEDFILYERDGDAFFPVGTRPAAAGCQDIVREIVAGSHDMLVRVELTAFALHGSRGEVGVLIVQTPSGQGLDQRVMLPLARIAGIALERAQLVQQLLDARAAARAEEFKTSLLSSVSHDLRTPLTTIRTAASSLLEFGDVLDSDTASELLGSIVDESDRLNHLTSNLLEMSRLQGGRDGLRLSVLPAGEIMRGVLARLERSSAQARIAIVAPREEVQIEVDPVLFELALVNVVENALVYSPPQSPVRIECLVEGETCVIAVTDQGPGIPPSDQVNVFKRFYRGQAGRDARKGSGLGLAIAKGFVEASRGRITIISPVGEERGTTIRLCLPLAEQRIAA